MFTAAHLTQMRIAWMTLRCTWLGGDIRRTGLELLELSRSGDLERAQRSHKRIPPVQRHRPRPDRGDPGPQASQVQHNVHPADAPTPRQGRDGRPSRSAEHPPVPARTRVTQRIAGFRRSGTWSKPLVGWSLSSETPSSNPQTLHKPTRVVGSRWNQSRWPHDLRRSRGRSPMWIEEGDSQRCCPGWSCTTR